MLYSASVVVCTYIHFIAEQYPLLPLVGQTVHLQHEFLAADLKSLVFFHTPLQV